MSIASSPFDRFRTRSLLKWPLPLIILAIIITGEATESSLLVVHRNIIFGFEIDVIIGIWIFLQCRRHSISIQRLVRTIPSEHWNWAYLSLALPLFLLSIGIVWVNLWLRHLLLLRFGPSVATSWLGHHPAFLPGTPLRTVVLLFQGVVLSPIVEELQYRGLFLHRWERKWGRTVALIATSLVFAIIHKDLLAAFVFGLVMAVLYLRTRTLLVPIACHGFYNALVTGSQAIRAVGNWWNGPLCLAASVPILLGFLYRYWPPPEACLPYYLPGEISGTD